MATEAFSKIMETIFIEGYRELYNEDNAFCNDTEDKCALFGTIGYHMGKWIYLIDAVDDIEENLETGAYNPLIYRFK